MTTILQQYTTDPASTITAPAVSATLTDAGAHLNSGRFSWESDLPGALGGTGGSPSPTAYLLGALAGCAVAYIADTLAPEFGVEITSLRATASCRSDLAGLVGAPGARPELSEPALTIDLASSSSRASIEALQAAWLSRCPVFLALTRPLDVQVTFTRDA